MPPGICVHCTNAYWTSSSSGRICLPTRRRCRCWIPAAVAPRVYASDRKAERPITHLDGFKCVLQVDGYAGYRRLAERGDVQLAFCWEWLRVKIGLISQKGKLAEAIRYASSRWEGLTRFLDDGRIELDNNTVEVPSARSR
jgi:hypothetical protein